MIDMYLHINQWIYTSYEITMPTRWLCYLDKTISGTEFTIPSILNTIYYI